MCLAVPAKLIECEADEAIADLHGNRVRISTLLVPQARIGDWVLIHAGFAIQKLEQDQAEATFAVLEDLNKHLDEPVPGVPGVTP
jgi:hydrogenase expression/formation protein HypC